MVGQYYGNAGRCSHAACIARTRRTGVLRAVGVLAAIGVLAAAGCDRAPPAPAHPQAPSAHAVDAAIQGAETYLNAQRPREAVQVATRLAADAPHLMRAHELHARALIALAFDPDTPQAERERVLGEAADAYDRASAIDPTNAALHHAAGVVSNTARRAQAARAHYEAAHRLEPANAQFALYLGLALAQEGRLDDARALLEDAQRRTPHSPDPSAALADLALRAGDFAAARTAIARARALDPDALGLRLADARIRRLSSHPDQALDLLLALDPPLRTQAGVAQEIALAHIALGDFTAAAVVLENSARAEPADWARAVRCGHAWQQAGDPVKAHLWFQNALTAGAPAEALDIDLRR